MIIFAKLFPDVVNNAIIFLVLILFFSAIFWVILIKKAFKELIIKVDKKTITINNYEISLNEINEFKYKLNTSSFGKITLILDNKNTIKITTLEKYDDFEKLVSNLKSKLDDK